MCSVYEVQTVNIRFDFLEQYIPSAGFRNTLTFGKELLCTVSTAFAQNRFFCC